MLQTFISAIIKTRLRVFLFLFCFGFILYGQTTTYSYTDLDDSILINENIAFLEKGSNAGKIFSQSVFSMRPEDHDNYYRPLLVGSFMLDAHIGGGSLWMFHITNILIHIIASFLLFLLFYKLQYKNEISFIAALIFLCHPVFTTAIAWVPGRNDSLLAVFFLAALFKLIDYHKNSNVVNLFFHHFFFLLCLFTKETALFLPPVLFFFLVLISKDKRLSKKNNLLVFNLKKSKSLLFIFGWVISVLIYEYFRHLALANADAVSFREVINVFEKYAPVIIQYIGKLLFPFNLSTYPIMEDTTYLFGLLGLIIIVFIFLKREKTLRYFWMGLVLFILFLLPAAIIKENALEHRLYLPAIGFFLMCMENSYVSKIRFDKGASGGIAILVVVLFSVLTMRNGKNYKDETTFWAKGLETSPHSAKVHFQMGAYYQIEGRSAEAENEYKQAIELNPDMPDVHNNLGKLLIAKEQYDEAEKVLLTEIGIKPNPVAYYNLATVYELKGNISEAKKYINKALEMNLNYADALVDLGILYAREKNFDKALDLCRQTLVADPENKLAYKNITLIYLAKKQLKEAKEYYLKSKQMGVEINVPLLDTLNTSSL